MVSQYQVAIRTNHASNLMICTGLGQLATVIEIYGTYMWLYVSQW